VFLFAIADLPKPGSKAYNKTRFLNDLFLGEIS